MQIVRGLAAIVGVAMVLMGGLWILQGLDIVRWPASSFMLGDIVWTRNGAVLAVLGVVLIWLKMVESPQTNTLPDVPNGPAVSVLVP